MARQRRTLDEQISELVTRGRSSRTEVQSVPAMAAIGSEMITGGAISQEHIQEGAVTPTAFSPEVRQVFDDLEGGLQGSAEAQRQLGEKITELKEVSLPALDKDLAASKERIEAIDGRLSPIDAGLALLQNQQIVVSDGIAELRDKTVPALSKDLESAAARLDSTDVLLNTTFPKLISDNLADAKADATTKANAAEAAAISAAASDAQTKADAAIAEALRLYEKAISSGSNMAADPSFEDGFGAYFNSTYFGTSTRKVAAGQARTGAAYLEVVQGSVATDAPSVRFRVSGITPGRVYAISAWAYRQTGGGSLSNSITGYFLNSAGTSLGWVPYVDIPTALGAWSQAEIGRAHV